MASHPRHVPTPRWLIWLAALRWPRFSRLRHRWRWLWTSNVGLALVIVIWTILCALWQVMGLHFIQGHL